MNSGQARTLWRIRNGRNLERSWGRRTHRKNLSLRKGTTDLVQSGFSKISTDRVRPFQKTITRKTTAKISTRTMEILVEQPAQAGLLNTKQTVALTDKPNTIRHHHQNTDRTTDHVNITKYHVLATTT